MRNFVLRAIALVVLVLLLAPQVLLAASSALDPWGGK